MCVVYFLLMMVRPYSSKILCYGIIYKATNSLNINVKIIYEYRKQIPIHLTIYC